uniref:uncharacterized protein LOC128929539 n=1 Tax=Callithrix jacchus TaxID=9483 RepID=UPI0023DD41FA|nr:uncharacterized protein LOC128929539 [Callithrix jacchus]
MPVVVMATQAKAGKMRVAACEQVTSRAALSFPSQEADAKTAAVHCPERKTAFSSLLSPKGNTVACFYFSKGCISPCGAPTSESTGSGILGTLPEAHSWIQSPAQCQAHRRENLSTCGKEERTSSTSWEDNRRLPSISWSSGRLWLWLATTTRRKQKPRAQTPALGVSGRLQLQGWGTRELWAHCRERDSYRSKRTRASTVLPVGRDHSLSRDCSKGKAGTAPTPGRAHEAVWVMSNTPHWFRHERKRIESGDQEDQTHLWPSWTHGLNKVNKPKFVFVHFFSTFQVCFFFFLNLLPDKQTLPMNCRRELCQFSLVTPAMKRILSLEFMHNPWVLRLALFGSKHIPSAAPASGDAVL